MAQPSAGLMVEQMAVWRAEELELNLVDYLEMYLVGLMVQKKECLTVDKLADRKEVSLVE